MSPNEWDFKQLAPNVTPQNAFKYGGWIILGVIVIVLLATSFYAVDTDARGVVLRFGRLVRTTQPGLHTKLPLRFEIVKTPRVERVFKEEFGFQTLEAGIETIYSKKDLTGVSLMVCGDLNIAEVEWAVHYKIEEPENFLFKVRAPRIIIRDLSEAVMRRIVGDSSVDEVLTTRRTEINIEFKEMLQRKLEEYGTGIRIDDVKLQSVVPPEKVKPAFDDVNTALQDKDRLINQAREEYNKVIAEAEGEARQMISQAQAYQINRVNVAKGDAKRFKQILEEYKKAEDVTRRRLYLETLTEVLPKIEKKYIMDEDIKSLLPLLKLGEE